MSGWEIDPNPWKSTHAQAYQDGSSDIMLDWIQASNQANPTLFDPPKLIYRDKWIKEWSKTYKLRDCHFLVWCLFLLFIWELPLTSIDIHGGQSHHSKKMKVMKKRKGALSPFIIEVGGRKFHITPFANPYWLPLGLANASLSPDGMPKRCSVMLIFCAPL